MFDRKMSEFNGITISLHINLVQAKDIFLPFILCARLTYTRSGERFELIFFFSGGNGGDIERNIRMWATTTTTCETTVPNVNIENIQPPKNININKIRHCIESAGALT